MLGLSLSAVKGRKYASPLFRDPWHYFAVFLGANFLLSYVPLEYPAKLWIFLLGILLPLRIAWSTARQARLGEKRFASKEILVPLDAWIWLGIIGLAIFLRFYGLVSLPVWPMWDDSSNSFFCIRQSENWNWNLWVSSEKIGPVCIWSRALFYKIFSPSLFSLWLFQAFESTVALFVGYWACRQYFSKSICFICVLILGLSFWPLFLGQFCTLEYPTFLWELISLGFFGFYWKSLDSNSQTWKAFGLGLFLGLGLYIWIITIPVTLILTASFLWTWSSLKKNKWNILAAFALPFLLLTLPAASEVIGNFFRGHVFAYSVVHSSKPFWDELVISFSYLTVFLWGTLDKSYFNFGPLWGGYFNPLLGAAFLLGMVELVRLRNRFFLYGATGAFTLCLVPGFISNTLEMMRVLPLLPFCILLAVAGLQKLLSVFPSVKRVWILALFFSVSLTLDLYHLWGPYHRWALPEKFSAGSKSPEHYQAFQVLDQWNREKGPGLIFSDFYYDVFDQSLLVSTYGFNAARNRKLDPEKADWAAILLDPTDQPAFSRRFAQASFYKLTQGLGIPEIRMELAIVPLTPENRDTFLRWIPLHRVIQDMYSEIPYHVAHPSFDKIFTQLWEIYGSVSKDDFLKASILKKIIEFSCQSPGEFSPQSASLAQAAPLLEVPLADIPSSGIFRQKSAMAFHRLGLYFLGNGDYSAARKAFQGAAHCDPTYPLSKILKELEERKRGLPSGGNETDPYSLTQRPSPGGPSGTG